MDSTRVENKTVSIFGRREMRDDAELQTIATITKLLVKQRIPTPASSSLPASPRRASARPSSRNFVLKIEDGTGKHAFIGFGFAERNEAFDFNVTLSDHDKYVKRETDNDVSAAGRNDNHIEVDPVVNHRLKKGETIRINVKPKPTGGTGMLSAAGLSGSALPPGIGKLRSPLPPPPNDPVAARISSGGVKNPQDKARKSSGPLSDLAQIERNLPTTTGSGSSTKTKGCVALAHDVELG